MILVIIQAPVLLREELGKVCAFPMVLGCKELAA